MFSQDSAAIFAMFMNVFAELMFSEWPDLSQLTKGPKIK